MLEDDNGGIFFRQFATGSGDLFPSGVNTMPSVANFFGSPTNTYNTAATVDISHLNDDQWIIAYIIGGGGGGAFSNGSRSGGGGGGSTVVAYPKGRWAGNSLSLIHI